MWTPIPTSPQTATLTPALTPTATSTPSLTHTPSLASTRTPDPERYYPQGTRISLIAPQGWIPFPHWEYTGLLGPRVKGFFTNIVIYADQDEADLARYSAQAQESISPDIAGYKPIKEEFLTTPAGLPYFRWEFQGTAEDARLIRIVVYIFEGGTHKEILQYTRPLNDGKELDKLVEEAIYSVRFEE